MDVDIKSQEVPHVVAVINTPAAAKGQIVP
jgi:hypothetical protein